MRKVTKFIVDAFLRKEKAHMGNSSTDGKVLTLHGNGIARHTPDGIEITNAGWFSSTTKERLNGLPGVHIQQKAGKWYLNGVEWNGTRTLIR